MLEKIILTVVTLDVIFITFLIVIERINRAENDRMREENIKILIPMIKELVKNNDNILRKSIYVSGNNFDYIEKLFSETYEELVQKLYHINFSFSQINHEEIEFRLRSYINKTILKELEMVKNIKIENKKVEKDNKTDITEHLYT